MVGVKIEEIGRSGALSNCRVFFVGSRRRDDAAKADLYSFSASSGCGLATMGVICERRPFVNSVAQVTSMKSRQSDGHPLVRFVRGNMVPLQQYRKGL